MKITICGSLKFFDEMVEIQRKLEKAGHEIFMPVKVQGVDYWGDNNKSRVEIKKGMEFFDKHMKKIEQSDAVLVVNITKRDVENYIGANTFAEMIFAHYKGKKIFILNPLPNQPYIKDEIESIESVVLNGNLNLIK